ncbi:hypothetical protein T01_13475 [Trichinella spiralis]|uniref:Uncharacterized protein n=1 Tax=Trichinella spiralis TaxID=6334 RepID=A0A0V1APJ8_TRISP|nr:hypothetical protein T01_13475 [Trichinella spiralis]
MLVRNNRNAPLLRTAPKGAISPTLGITDLENHVHALVFFHLDLTSAPSLKFCTALQFLLVCAIIQRKSRLDSSHLSPLVLCFPTVIVPFQSYIQQGLYVIPSASSTIALQSVTIQYTTIRLAGPEMLSTIRHC